MGSVVELPNGRYRARYRDNHGRSRSQTFRLKKDARDFLKTVGADVLRGAYVDPRLGRVTFETWANEWFATTVNLRPGSRARYGEILDCVLIPAFGRMQLGQIGPLEIRKWLAEMTDVLPTSAVRRNYVQMRMVMKAAVEADLVVKTPCLPKLPPATQAEMRFLNVAEVEELAGAINPHFRALVYLFAYGGLRWGEAAGLKRKFVDTMRRTVRVEEQLTEVNNLLLLGQPLKTKAARRTVAIPRFLAEIVDEHLGRLEALREHRGLGPVGPDDVMFVNTRGGLLRRGGFRTNYWLPALTKAGLEGVRVHDLRHTAVAFAINLTDAHPKAVQVRFGHSSIQQTYDRYGHLFPQMDVSIADGLDDARQSACTAPPDRATVTAFNRASGAEASP